MTPAAPAALAGVVATVLAVLGFNDAATQAAVKSVIVAGYALVVGIVACVHVVQHYRTQRHADELAASLKRARDAVGTPYVPMVLPSSTSPVVPPPTSPPTR